jgi:hypothetical protein
MSGAGPHGGPSVPATIVIVVDMVPSAFVETTWL